MVAGRDRPPAGHHSGRRQPDLHGKNPASRGHFKPVKAHGSPREKTPAHSRNRPTPAHGSRIPQRAAQSSAGAAGEFIEIPARVADGAHGKKIIRRLSEIPNSKIQNSGKFQIPNFKKRLQILIWGWILKFSIAAGRPERRVYAAAEGQSLRGRKD